MAQAALNYLRTHYRKVLPNRLRAKLTPVFGWAGKTAWALLTPQLQQKISDPRPMTPEYLLGTERFEELVQFVEANLNHDPDEMIRFCWAAIGNREYLANAYIVMAKALTAKGDLKERDRIAAILGGKVAALAQRGEFDFFRQIVGAFPEVYADFQAGAIQGLLARKKFDELVQFVERMIEQKPDDTIRFCWAAIGNREYLANAYVVMAKALIAKDDIKERNRIAGIARDKGLALIEKGELAQGAAFFRQVAHAFPDTCRGLSILYERMNAITEFYRRRRSKRINRSTRRSIIISLSVWGKSHVDLFMRYFVPSILSANNLPALSRVRRVEFDIYTIKEDIGRIKATPAYRKLKRYAKVNFMEFPTALLTCREYNELPGFKHRLFGGFHHTSIEHARAENADLMSVAPDGIYSDGALSSYARFIDQGCKAVLITGMKAQAEPLLPILDSMRDRTTQSITLPPRALVALNAAYVHHDFKRFIMTKGNTGIPPGLSLLFFPNPHGFYGRCFHLFPIVLSADAVKKDIAFDYFTLDSNSLTRIFPGPETWKDIKVIDDSDDGVMLDLAFSYEEPTFEPCEFSPEQLIRQLPGYRANHFWHFGHRIVYRADRPIDAVGTFNRKSDGTLERIFLPVSSAIDIADDKLADWFEAARPK
jgi:hypothetical protein